MNLTALDPSTTKHWMEIHKTGCRDIRGRTHWTFDAETLTEAAEEVGSDFLYEGSMTLQDVLYSTHFAPCVKLPLEAPK